ncbi:MAG: hypothetical protein ACI9LM_000784 [Alteromonadaceae bacterium]|jgi:hypothetical protein
MIGYLGSHVSKILESKPFKYWHVEKSTEDNLDERITHYIFNQNGFELRCDNNNNISAIFLHSEEYGGFDENLLEFPFLLKREQVIKHIGTPSKSGAKLEHPILGECGAWDRFSGSASTIHIEYKLNVDEINKITLMRSDIVP